MNNGLELINPFNYHLCLTDPKRIVTSAWIEHVPFAMFIIEILRPGTLVELGTHSGVSYCAFCQAVKQLQLDTRCYAVDTWQGDAQTGYYDNSVFVELRSHHDPIYSGFSTLLQSTFDEAIVYFSDNSIDLLHIDGCHTYEQVKHDFDSWLPKLSDRAVVLFHDTNVRERDFGVWKLWEELSGSYPSFEFYHGKGLGVLKVGKAPTPEFDQFLNQSPDAQFKIREFFSFAGSRITRKLEIDQCIVFFQKELEEKQGVLNSVTSQQEESERGNQALTGQLAESEQTNQELRNQLAGSQQANQELRNQLAGSQQANQELRIQLAEKEQANSSLTSQLVESEKTGQQFQTRLTETENNVGIITQKLSESDSTTQALREKINSQSSGLRDLQDKLIAAQNDAQHFSSLLWEIYGSTAWSIVRMLWKIRLTIAPRGGAREKMGKTLLRTIKKIRGAKGNIDTVEGQSATSAGSTPESGHPDPGITTHSSKPNIVDSAVLIYDRFPLSRPLVAYSTPDNSKRINLVTDSINSGSLFGGVATSIILSTLLAERLDCDLRVVTRTELANKDNFNCILEANRLSFSKNVEFLFANCYNPDSEIPVGGNDIFLTTSWWTTQSVKHTFNEKNIIYLLQEDERAFYPYGDDHLRCSQLLMSPDIQFVINTELLFNHFVSEGFGNIRKNGLWFEPSWPEDLFFYDERHPGDKKNFFFYARPNNIRNLYYLGIEVIQTAIEKGILDSDEWDFHFAGKDLSEFQIDSKIHPKIYQNLNWFDYAALVRKMDLGLSLMYTPHPSYPPLDLAASGAVVVTNRYGLKQDLNQYSKNIICSDLSVDALVQGIVNGRNLANDFEARLNNYRQNKINRDWKLSFENVITQLCRRF